MASRFEGPGMALYRILLNNYDSDVSQRLHDYLDHLPRNDQYQLLSDFFALSTFVSEKRISDLFIAPWEYFTTAELWNCEFSSLDEFEDAFPHTCTIKVAATHRRVNRCLRNLFVTDPESDMARIEWEKCGFLGPVEESYMWILSHPDFAGWRDELLLDNRRSGQGQDNAINWCRQGITKVNG